MIELTDGKEILKSDFDQPADDEEDEKIKQARIDRKKRKKK